MLIIFGALLLFVSGLTFGHYTLPTSDVPSLAFVGQILMLITGCALLMYDYCERV